MVNSWFDNPSVCCALFPWATTLAIIIQVWYPFYNSLLLTTISTPFWHTNIGGSRPHNWSGLRRFSGQLPNACMRKENAKRWCGIPDYGRCPHSGVFSPWNMSIVGIIFVLLIYLFILTNIATFGYMLKFFVCAMWVLKNPMTSLIGHNGTHGLLPRSDVVAILWRTVATKGNQQLMGDLVTLTAYPHICLRPCILLTSQSQTHT